MPRRKLSREELFALWEKPTSEIAKELDLSDVAIGKLCSKLQVPKPPRGYWARMQAGQRPRRPALVAFREELDTKRRDELRAKTAESLSKLQRQFLEMALSEMNSRGAGIAPPPGARPLVNLDRDVAAQVLLLIQGRAQAWVEEGRIATRWGPPVRNSVAKLVERLLPMARQQLLVFETEIRRTSFRADGPVIFVRLTVPLQERIAALSEMVRDQELQHVVMPLTAADHAWSTHHLYSPESRLFLDSWLCISVREIWVEWNRKSWREEDPPERHATNRIGLREVMPVDFLPASNKSALTGDFGGGNHALCGSASRPARSGTDPRDDEQRRLRNAEGGPGRNPFGRGSPVVWGGASIPGRARRVPPCRNRA
ncbi:hypothetical protein [Rhizobium sp. BK456]|uniref:hypothetical protein n=1 Tax=Rhizobium sp. BK456 TaxID=2587007 RepID=UPI001FEDDEFB|nr:hypothetical protein [Rhizobium sp. BK456]